MAVMRQAFASVPSDAEGAEQTVPTKEGRLLLTQAQLERIRKLPAQVGSMVRQLMERGWFEFARAEMLAGRNPGRNDWQRVLCAGLIDGGVSRAGLIASYETELRMTPGSAKVRASKAVAVFSAGQLLLELNGHLYLRQNKSDN